MTTTPLTAVGPALGVLLPPDVQQKLNVSAGDQLAFTETPNGFEITAVSSKVAKQVEIARAVMVENWEALEQLSK